MIERILLEAKEMCRADGGTLYLMTEADTLRLALVRTSSLGLALGGSTGMRVVIPEVPLYQDGEPNHKNVASHCALIRESVNIADAYDAEGFDFSGTKQFDERNGYRTCSVLTIPMKNQDDEIIGVLQL